MQITRLLISLGLAIGVLVFGVFVFQELSKPANSQPLPTDFGTSADIQTPAPPAAENTGSTLQQIGGLDPNKYIPIRRDNPHPGEIAPFLGTASYVYPPYQQPPIAGVVWEFGTYRRPDANPEAAFEYYNQQAAARGFQLNDKQATSPHRPGEIKASWSNGTHKLVLTAWPLPITEPVQAPLKPKTPLQWVVQYSYPENESPRQPIP